MEHLSNLGAVGPSAQEQNFFENNKKKARIVINTKPKVVDDFFHSVIEDRDHNKQVTYHIGYSSAPIPVSKCATENDRFVTLGKQDLVDLLDLIWGFIVNKFEERAANRSLPLNETDHE